MSPGTHFSFFCLLVIRIRMSMNTSTRHANFDLRVLWVTVGDLGSMQKFSFQVYWRLMTKNNFCHTLGFYHGFLLTRNNFSFRALRGYFFDTSVCGLFLVDFTCKTLTNQASKQNKKMPKNALTGTQKVFHMAQYTSEWQILLFLN